MKRLVIFGILTLALLLPLASWSCVPEKTTVSFGKEFTLPVGETVVFDSVDLSIYFIEVASDSRCPKGVVCIWAGEAQCRLFFTLAGSPAEMVIVQPGGEVYARDYFIQYRLDFKLEPYPREGQQIAPSDYKLIMTITK